MRTNRERAEALGIDPDDPKYHPLGGHYFKAGDTLCPWCLRHPVRLPRLHCDVAQAEAQEDEVGCVWCGEPAPMETRRCERCAAREKRDAEAARRRYSGPPRSRAIYRDDGHGCVERVHPTELMIERLEKTGPEGGEW